MVIIALLVLLHFCHSHGLSHSAMECLCVLCSVACTSVAAVPGGVWGHVGWLNHDNLIKDFSLYVSVVLENTECNLVSFACDLFLFFLNMTLE